jgi:hypothetical protein
VPKSSQPKFCSTNEVHVHHHSKMRNCQGCFWRKAAVISVVPDMDGE